MYWLVYRKRNSFLWTLSLLKHFKCWWNFCSRIVSQRCLAGQQCSFQKLCFNLECMKSGNWSKRSYNVLQTCRNYFVKDIISHHNGSEWVKAPILFLTQSWNPVSCCRKAVERPNEIISRQILMDRPLLVSRSKRSGRTTESDSGSGPLVT